VPPSAYKLRCGARKIIPVIVTRAVGILLTIKNSKSYITFEKMFCFY